MIELKDYDIMDIEAMDDERVKTESAPGKWVPRSRVYLKSEADKVIAELEKKVKCATCDNTMSEYRAFRFPICDDCLKALREIIKERK